MGPGPHTQMVMNFTFRKRALWKSKHAFSLSPTTEKVQKKYFIQFHYMVSAPPSA